MHIGRGSGALADRADTTAMTPLESLHVALHWCFRFVEIKGLLGLVERANSQRAGRQSRRVQRPAETSIGVKVKRPIVVHTDAIMPIPFQPISSPCCVVSPPASAGL